MATLVVERTVAAPTSLTFKARDAAPTVQPVPREPVSQHRSRLITRLAPSSDESATLLNALHRDIAQRRGSLRPSAIRQRRFSVSARPAQHDAVEYYWPQAGGATFLTAQQEWLCCRLIQEAHLVHMSTAGTTLTVQQRQRLKQVTDLAAQARSLLLRACRKYIFLQAKRLQAGQAESRRVPIDDMFLAGVTGLYAAALKYDTTSTSSSLASQQQQQQHSSGGSGRFLTFAHHYICKAMRATLKSHEQNDVYIPQRLTDIKAKIAAAIASLQAESKSGGPRPSIKAVAAATGVPARTVADVVHAHTLQLASFEETSNQDDDPKQAAAVLYLDEGSVGGEQQEGHMVLAGGHTVAMHSRAQAQVEQEIKQRVLQDVLAGLQRMLAGVLTDRERLVVSRLMGLSGPGAQPAISAQLAAELGVSRQRVEQILGGALGKLQRACDVQPRLRQDLHDIATFFDV